MFCAGNGNSFFGERKHGSASHFEERREQRCHTVTQKIGNMVTTYTQCSWSPPKGQRSRPSPARVRTNAENSYWTLYRVYVSAVSQIWLSNRRCKPLHVDHTMIRLIRETNHSLQAQKMPCDIFPNQEWIKNLSRGWVEQQEFYLDFYLFHKYFPLHILPNLYIVILQ